MSTRQISRRRFLIAGCGGLVLVLAGCGTEANLATCPYGEVNDPYPGRCHRYFDFDGDGICDLSQASVSTSEVAAALPTAAESTPTKVDVDEDVAAEGAVESAPTEATTAVAATPAAADTPTSAPVAAPTAAVQTRCPKGLVYDPYPGRCPRYVDKDGDGYCDLSVVV